MIISKILKLATAGFFVFGMFPGSPLAAANSALDECSKELLLAYFPEVFVTETLKKFNVPEDKWDSIKKELANKDKDVVKTVEEKASQMDPNPLKDPLQRQAAVKIFRETLLQIFGDALRANGIDDQRQIQSMLEDIQKQKARRFAECMEKYKTSAKKDVDHDQNEDNDDQDDDEPTTKDYANQK